MWQFSKTDFFFYISEIIIFATFRVEHSKEKGALCGVYRDSDERENHQIEKRVNALRLTFLEEGRRRCACDVAEGECSDGERPVPTAERATGVYTYRK